MASWARVVGGTVAEVITFNPVGLFTPDVASLFVPVPDGTEAGATQNSNGTFTAPPPPPPYVAPPAPPPAVPASVPMWQAKAALAAQASATAGVTMLAAANTAVTTVGGTLAIYWEYATTLDRADPNVATIGTALSLTSAQIDALFIAAAALSV